MLQKEMQSMNQVKSSFQVITATISTLYFGLFAYGAFILIQQFESIFDSFEAELPIQTSILIGTYRFWGILGLISAFILYEVSKGRSRKSMKLLIWLLVLSLLLVPFAIWGIYSPVLEGSGQPAT
jgi:type II secretory pathway component PulF